MSRFRETFFEEPNILAAQAFDAAKIFVTLLENKQILSRESMQRELSRIEDFPGISGFKGFDPTGNAIKRPFLLTVQEKAFHELSPDLENPLNHP